MIFGKSSPITLFLDANILISAAWRANTEISKIWQLEGIRLVTSSYVMGEVQRNLPRMDQIERLRGLMVSVQIFAAEKLPEIPQSLELPEKDRPILAGAIQAHADHLISGDKKHFGPWYGKTVCGVRITAPTELLAVLHHKLP